MQLRATAAVLALAISSIAVQSWAGDAVDAANALFDRGHSQEAVKLLQDAAAQNDHEAQAELGGLHFSGNGVRQDYALAETFLRAALSEPKAAYKRDLACILYHRGGAERLRESASLIEQAAAERDALALVYESRLYRLGVERPANPSFGNYKLEQALIQIYKRPSRDAKSYEYLQVHLPHILGNGVCGPADEYGAFLAKSFPMRFREWPQAGKRSSSNPLFLYLKD